MDPEMLRAVLPSALGALVVLAGCDPTGALVPLDLDRIEQALGAPTGELETTDARGLAYTVYNARTVLSAVTVAAEVLPGIDRSPLFMPRQLSGCTKDVPRGFEVDFPCLGLVAGKLRLEAMSELANDNGTYQLSLTRASLAAGLYAEGTFQMRVEGIANPVAVEKTTLAPVARINGMPRFFEVLEEAGIVIDNTRGNEALYYVVAILGGTFVIQVDEQQSSDTALVYSIEDAKNLWSCVSKRDANTITESECRTPVGQGDFAELKF